jgi:anti-anti-sigma factor
MTAPPDHETLRDHFDIEIDVGEREISLFGDVDSATAPLLSAAASSLLNAAPGALTVDLGGVTFGDSTLLNAIEEIRAALDGHELRLINPSAAVKRLFLAGGAAELLREAPGG